MQGMVYIVCGVKVSPNIKLENKYNEILNVFFFFFKNNLSLMPNIMCSWFRLSFVWVIIDLVGLNN